MQVKFRLPPGAVPVAVSCRPVLARTGIGGAASGPVTVTVRYALPGGAVAKLKRRVYVAAPLQRQVRCEGWAVAHGTVTVSLGFGEAADEPAAVADRFVVPLEGLSGALPGLEVNLRAACRRSRGGLALHGALWVRMADGWTVTPFCRAVSAPSAGRWEGWAAVARLALARTGDGTVRGEAEVVWGARAPVSPAPGVRPLRKVRDLSARVEQVEAEPAGPGAVLVRGLLVMELFWVDEGGMSRFLRKTERFSALVEIACSHQVTGGLDLAAERCEAGAGAGPGGPQKVEAVGALCALQHRVRTGTVAVSAEVGVRVTVLQPVELDGWLLDRVIGKGTAVVEVEALLHPGAPPSGSAAVSGAAPLQGWPEPWRELTAAAGPVTFVADGRWRLQAELVVDGQRTEREVQGALPQAASAGAGARLSGLAGVAALSPDRLQVAAAFWWGGEEPQRAQSERSLAVSFPLPEPVRTVLRAGVAPAPGGLRVEALVRTEQGALRLAGGRVAAPAGRPESLTVAVSGGRLHAVIGLVGPE